MTLLAKRQKPPLKTSAVLGLCVVLEGLLAGVNSCLFSKIRLVEYIFSHRQNIGAPKLFAL